MIIQVELTSKGNEEEDIVILLGYQPKRRELENTISAYVGGIIGKQVEAEIKLIFGNQSI